MQEAPGAQGDSVQEVQGKKCHVTSAVTFMVLSNCTIIEYNISHSRGTQDKDFETVY